MVRAKFNYPDLDVLDSPPLVSPSLISSTPLTSVGGIPGSAIAEKIFNDPKSWEENEDDTDIRPISTSSLPLQIHSASTVASSTQEGPSPVAIYSSSTTMSFLEWYGIYTDAPLNGRSAMQPPSRLPRSQPPAPTPSQPSKPSDPPLRLNTRVLSSLPLHTRMSSPAGSRPKSNPSSPSSSNPRSQSRTYTPAQGMSDSDSNGTARRCRLPSIPRSSTAPESLTSAFVSPRLSSSQPSASLPLPALRSSLVRPAGPRARASQLGHQDAQGTCFDLPCHA